MTATNTEKSRRPTLRKVVVFLVLSGLTLVAMQLIFSAYPSHSESGALAYLAVVFALGMGYTILPFVRDSPQTLLVWPGVISLLASVAVVELFGFVGPVLGEGLIAVALLLFVLAPVLVIKAILMTLGRDDLSFVHPLLLSSLVGTRRTHDRPAVLTIQFEPSRFPDMVALARFLVRERLADSVGIHTRRVTVRLARVAGLSKIWYLLMAPFGQTVVWLDSKGVASVYVEPHTYRLMDRPGPYDRYCRNLVDSLIRMATLLSADRLDEARRVARLE